MAIYALFRPFIGKGLKKGRRGGASGVSIIMPLVTGPLAGTLRHPYPTGVVKLGHNDPNRLSEAIIYECEGLRLKELVLGLLVTLTSRRRAMSLV